MRLLFLALAFAWSAPTSESYTIRGIVRASKTAEPLDGAVIILECECLTEPRETTTDECGRYTFDDLPPGRYTVSALRGHAMLSRLVDVGAE